MQFRLRHSCVNTWFYRGLLALISSLVIAACDNVPTESEPNLSGTTLNRVLAYTGPSCGAGISDPDVQKDACTFKVEFWNKMVESPCANCHDSQSGTRQTPFFLDSSDVNVAYNQALTVVDKAVPANSRIIDKIAVDHHNCGDAGSCGALATIVEGYITNWANGGSATSGGEANNQIVLTSPTIRDPGTSRSFPATATTLGTNSTSFAATIWPIVHDNCSGCHKESAAIPQSPFFADDNVDKAYDALVTSQKINLDDPSVSRLVVRLNPELHNCWDPNNTGGADCPASAAVMLNAITAFRDGIPLSTVNPGWVISKALDLTDGILASGGSRNDSSTIALYEMKTGSGNTLYDTSGVEPALNLNLIGTNDIDYRWVGGWGMEFISGRAQGSAQNTKLRDQIAATGEYSIEAWVVPANVNQGTAGDPARIISYSGSSSSRNFTLGQAEYRYEFMNRNENSVDANGSPSFITDADDEDLQASQQHVVATYDPIAGRKIYVNGVDVSTIGNADADPGVLPGGNLLNWDDSFAFILGAEAGGSKQWKGKLRLVAIHNRAMTQAQVQQNFDAGVGEKFYLLFSVSHLMDDDTNCYLDPVAKTGDQCFIYMLVSQFDSYSYLFNEPIFVNLSNATYTPAGTINIRGMRIGVNGKEPVVGQAFTNLGKGTTLSITNSGQTLSTIGTIIALEKGAGADEFFLSFEEFGSHTDGNIHADAEYVCADSSCLVATQITGTETSDIGMRTFDEINATMSALTGIARTNTSVNTTFERIKQQLPSSEDINTFLSAHEIGIAQLAIEYCNALVDDTTARAIYFPGFGFTTTHADANAVSDADWQNLVIKPLVNKMLTIDMDVSAKILATQPDPASLSAELLTLITNPADVRLSDDSDPGSNDGIPDGLAKCGGACPAGRTELVVKATCATVLGSAVNLVH